MRCVTQEQQIWFHTTTHEMPPSNPSSGMAGNPHLLPRLSRTHWGKPGGFLQGQRISKKVLPMHVCLSPTSGKGCLLDQVRQRQVRADVVLQPAALPQEQPPPALLQQQRSCAWTTCLRISPDQPFPGRLGQQHQQKLLKAH